MSVVGRTFFAGVVSVFGAISVAPSALAERVYSQEYTITVSATVLAHRTIIVDANGVITQISSNVNDNITPDVRFLTNAGPLIPLTFAISKEYQHLMSQVKDNHILMMDRQGSTINGLMPTYLLPLAQNTYLVKPSDVGNTPNTPYTIFE